ncbi:MAG: hypothetical protein ACOVRN_07405 [Flavobacterium sp.]
MKKCPTGVVCIEHYSMFFMVICILSLVYIVYATVFKQNIVVNNTLSETNSRENTRLIPSWPYTNLPSDPLLNPFAPPLRDERYLVPTGMVPINVSTNVGAVDAPYRQLGILTATNSKGSIIPLMGRPLFTNRDKWQYYTMSDQNNSIKLPVSRSGRSCTNEYGCDKLYNGDSVYIEGLNEPYRVTVYDNDTIKYLPYI